MVEKYILNSNVLQTHTICMEHRQISDSLHICYFLLLVEESARQYYSFALALHNAADSMLDFKLISDITESREDADSLFAKIANGGVTPDTLTDILSDLL